MPVGLLRSKGRSWLQRVWEDLSYSFLASANEVEGVEIIHEFGFATVGTSYTPICAGGVWRTPKFDSPVILRIAAGNAADNPAGAGARAVTVEYINSSGFRVIGTIATNGASAGTETITDVVRVNRAFVSSSGSYFDPNATIVQSHTGSVVLEDTNSNTWLTIPANDLARGQSLIGCYHVPKGYTAYIRDLEINSGSSKILDFVFGQRQNADLIEAPYSSFRVFSEAQDLSQPFRKQFDDPVGGFAENTDIISLARVNNSTGETGIEFEIELVNNAILFGT
jgi:hypothetical protein